MNNEVAILRGKIAVNEKLVETYSAEINGDISQLRILADKSEPKESLETGTMKIIVDRIHDRAVLIRKLKDIIKGLKQDLGE
ncbi:MAG: hypothetical protein FWE57_04325 [Chitinispirillia bacterium]|nr:hypothetical protein [Chitinispirillia bacterium]